MSPHVVSNTLTALYYGYLDLAVASMSGCGIEEKESNFVLISDLVNETLKGNDSGFNHFDLILVMYGR